MTPEVEPGTLLLRVIIWNGDRIEFDSVPILCWFDEGKERWPVVQEVGYSLPILCKPPNRFHAQAVLSPPITPAKLINNIKAMLFEAEMFAPDRYPLEGNLFAHWCDKSYAWRQLADIPARLKGLAS